MQSGTVVVGNSPVVGNLDPISTGSPPATTTRSVQGIIENTGTAIDDPPPVVDGAEWRPITDVNPEKGAVKPDEIMFPDGSRAPIAYWNRVMIETVRWLVNNQFLTTDLLPIQYGKRSIVSTSPRHPTGIQMLNPHHIPPVYIESNYNGHDQVRNARTIIERVGQGSAHSSRSGSDNPVNSYPANGLTISRLPIRG